MNKSELVEAIAKATKLTKVDVAKVVDALVEVSKKELKKGGEINLVGFLSLKKVKRSARTGRNPRTGKELKIAAKNVVKAKVGKTLNDAVK
jgi:DNA-binding protein HU-beta